MRKLLSTITLCLMACLPMQAQDRLIPVNAFTGIKTYDEDLSKYLSDGSYMLALEGDGSMIGEWALNYDRKTRELVSVRARNHIWNWRYYRHDYEYDDEELMKHEMEEREEARKSRTERPEVVLEKHRLAVPDSVERLIEDALDAAVGAAMPRVYDNGGVTLDGTSYHFISNGKIAKQRYCGKNCERLAHLMWKLNQAVMEESMDSVQLLLPGLREIKRHFRQLRYPADCYEPQVQHYYSAPQGYEVATAELTFFRMTFNLTDTVAVDPANRNLAYDQVRHKVDSRVDRLVDKYGKSWEELAQRLYVETHVLDKMQHPLCIYVRPDYTTPTLQRDHGEYKLQVTESQLTPKRIAQLLEGIERLYPVQGNSRDTYYYDKGWKKK